jgi:hypothetical protein
MTGNLPCQAPLANEYLSFFGGKPAKARFPAEFQETVPKTETWRGSPILADFFSFPPEKTSATRDRAHIGYHLLGPLITGASSASRLPAG